MATEKEKSISHRHGQQTLALVEMRCNPSNFRSRNLDYYLD